MSRAAVFQPGRVPVVGRFALAGGNPHAVDTMQTVRSLALRFSLPEGEEWRTAMINIPIFVVRTPEAFRDQIVAMAPIRGPGNPIREGAGVPRGASGVRTGPGGDQGRADRVRLREHHLQRPQRLRARRFVRQVDAGPLVDGASAAVRPGRAGPADERSELPLRRADRPGEAQSAPVAPGPDDRSSPAIRRTTPRSPGPQTARRSTPARSRSTGSRARTRAPSARSTSTRSSFPTGSPPRTIRC